MLVGARFIECDLIACQFGEWSVLVLDLPDIKHIAVRILVIELDSNMFRKTFAVLLKV